MKTTVNQYGRIILKNKAVLAKLLLRNGQETDGSSGRFALPFEYKDII